MRKSRFTEIQITTALCEASQGVPVKEVCRTLGISDATFYSWRKDYFGLDAADLKHLRDLEEENKRLKNVLAVLTEDARILTSLDAQSSIKA